MDELSEYIVNYRDLILEEDSKIYDALNTLGIELKREGFMEQSLRTLLLASLFHNATDVTGTLSDYIKIKIKEEGKEGVDEMLDLLDRFPGSRDPSLSAASRPRTPMRP